MRDNKGNLHLDHRALLGLDHPEEELYHLIHFSSQFG
jgi:hypothetical protein